MTACMFFVIDEQIEQIAHFHTKAASRTLSSCNFLYLFPSPSLYFPISPSTSQLGETHMGDLPAGMPAPVPNHGALTLPPSVSASPVCCRFANRTIQMVSSLLPLWPPTLATSEGQRDSLRDLWFSTVCHAAPRFVISHPWVAFF